MTDYWHVASYGYPNPFGDKRAVRTWEIFASFASIGSYRAVKDYWESDSVSPTMSAHAVESRKSSFEEFGLLYVLAGSDQVVVTPGGYQLLEAAESGDRDQFIWVAVNLLIRFPLQGPPRSKVTSNAASGFPIYHFMYSALSELQNYVWLHELAYVLSGVTTPDGAQRAIEKVRALRTGTEQFADTLPELRDAFYNAINQIINHVGLAGLIVDSKWEISPYGTELHRRATLLSAPSELVRVAIGGTGLQAGGGDDDCTAPDQFIRRIPMVPAFADEEEYFTYLGGKVGSLSEARRLTEEVLPQVAFGQENVSVLSEGVHYSLSGGDITGSVSTLCRISRGQRVVLSHDPEWTYKVRDKKRSSADDVLVTVTKSKPISNLEAFLPYFEGNE